MFTGGYGLLTHGHIWDDQGKRYGLFAAWIHLDVPFWETAKKVQVEMG